MVEQYRGTKTEHAISMLSMLRFAVGYLRFINMGLFRLFIWRLRGV